MSWARNSVGERGDNIGLPDVTTADNGKIMEVEAGEWKLKEGSGGGGGIPAPASPTDGDVLTYDGTTSAWVAEAPSGGGGVNVIYADYDEQTFEWTCRNTFTEIKTMFNSHVPVFMYIESAQSEISESCARVVNISEDAENNAYGVCAYTTWDMLFSTSSPSGYPSFSEE